MAANGVERECDALPQVLSRATHDPAGELARSRPRPTRSEQVDVVRERDQEPLAAGIAAPLRAEPLSERGSQLGKPRAGRRLGRQRAAMLVEHCLALGGEGEQREHLVELLRPRRRLLVEGKREGVQQRIERVPPLSLH